MADKTSTRAGQDSDAAVLAQQERIARHVGDLVAQAEADAKTERQAERDERREQHGALVGALTQLTEAVSTFASGNEEVKRQMETLQSEVKTLRAAILLAHSIGREEGGSSPLGLDVAQGERFSGDPFAAFPIPSGNGRRRNANPDKPRRKRVMSDEARARISAAQKARWARQRGQTSDDEAASDES